MAEWLNAADFDSVKFKYTSRWSESNSQCHTKIDSKEGIGIHSLIDEYSKEELEDIVKNSLSYAEVIVKLGYNGRSGDNLKILKDRIEKYDISVEHFSTTIVRRKRKLTDEEVFCEDSKVNQSTLRKRFMDLNHVPYICSICGQEPVWNGKPLGLTLDHQNGKNRDNRLDNLRWVCPNCDRQLDTFCVGDKNNKKEKKKWFCVNCGKEINPGYTKCRECADIDQRKVKRPTREELEKAIKDNNGNFSKVGKLYGVTDNAIRKWCVKYGLPNHSRDYK